jgi:hypothetical protein
VLDTAQELCKLGGAFILAMVALSASRSCRKRGIGKEEILIAHSGGS